MNCEKCGLDMIIEHKYRISTDCVCVGCSEVIPLKKKSVCTYVFEDKGHVLRLETPVKCSCGSIFDLVRMCQTKDEEEYLEVFAGFFAHLEEG